MVPWPKAEFGFAGLNQPFEDHTPVGYLAFLVFLALHMTHVRLFKKNVYCKV
jgi:hypothetical protein